MHDIPMITITPFAPADEAAVIDLIVPIQHLEFGVPITADDQPDLRAIPDFYQTGGGGFWVARDGTRIVGTIALKNFGDRQAALRKMFVAADHRGREHDVGGRLLSTAIAHARAAGLTTIILGTTEAFVAAHRFYEKNGFTRLAKPDLPAGFPLMPLDTRFYTLAL